jgi:hypothetical protein
MQRIEVPREGEIGLSQEPTVFHAKARKPVGDPFFLRRSKAILAEMHFFALTLPLPSDIVSYDFAP